MPCCGKTCSTSDSLDIYLSTFLTCVLHRFPRFSDVQEMAGVLTISRSLSIGLKRVQSSLAVSFLVLHHQPAATAAFGCAYQLASWATCRVERWLPCRWSLSVPCRWWAVPLPIVCMNYSIEGNGRKSSFSLGFSLKGGNHCPSLNKINFIFTLTVWGSLWGHSIN